MNEQNDAQQDTSAAQPVDASPASSGNQAPPSETPATPAHEVADAASGQGDDDAVVENDDPEPDPVIEPDTPDRDADQDTGDMDGLPEESLQADETDDKSLG